jgi:alpha-beta hydrolase superfamily lysophospholipase
MHFAFIQVGSARSSGIAYWRGNGFSPQRLGLGFRGTATMRWLPLCFLLPPLAWGLLGCLLATVGAYGWHLASLPPLEPWHLARLEAEFRAADASLVPDLAAYRALEDRLAGELRREVTDRVPPEGRTRVNRFWSGSPLNPERFLANWNRTVELPAASPVAGALLLHGLSDSPYSMRAVAEVLNREGVHALALRLPGHGTAPSGLLEAGVEDWRAAVRLGARHLRAAIGPDRPLLLVGYSNGAALAVDHALAALEDPGLPQVQGLVLLSPALAVTPAAGFARYLGLLAGATGQDVMAWTDLQPEFDPYKYNSFTLNAGAQIHALTADIAWRLDRLARAGGVGAFPPVLAFQSVVDATVVAGGIVTNVLARLPAGGGHELVAFDVNRKEALAALLRPGPGEAAGRLLEGTPWPFAVTVVGNRRPDTLALAARHRAAGAAAIEEEPLALAWPQDLFSLSHVALPFPPDDPLYGEAGPDGRITLGSLALAGERGILLIPDGFFLRLRYNPFFPYVAERVRAFLAERLDAP